MYKLSGLKPAITSFEKPDYSLFPSEFVSNFINIPTGGDVAPFSFKNREYLIPVYDTPANKVLLQFGRQSEKSTCLGNVMLTYTLLRKHFKALYVSPTQIQTEVFSRDRIAEPIQISPKIHALTSGGVDTKANVLYKRFRTNSEIILRSAFLHADRVRGIPVDMLFMDELQDIITDVIPIIEECLSHSPFKLRRYSGTPKSTDNTLSYYWSNFSTQNEWAVPCDACNHWNIMGMENIGENFLMCSKCKRQIFPNNPRAQWVSARSKEWLKHPPIDPFEGFRIAQPMAPWIKWGEIIDKLKRYPTAQFYNEVLGLPYDSGSKLIDRDCLVACCHDTYTMKNFESFIGRSATFMGVDWTGGGESLNSYTVITIATYIKDRFTVLYARRLEGKDNERDVEIIKQLVNKYHVSLIGVDYGGGLKQNDALIRAFGIERVIRYQYVNTRRLYYDGALSRFMVNRTEALMAVINAINRMDTFTFPKWTEFETPFGTDIQAIFGEFPPGENRVMSVQRSPGSPDDTLHSLLYCFLASMIKHPRPDIITPTGDDK